MLRGEEQRELHPRSVLRPVDRLVGAVEAAHELIAERRVRVDAREVDLERSAEQGIELSELERRYIELVLDRCGGNKVKASRVLGIDRSTLWRKLSSG